MAMGKLTAGFHCLSHAPAYRLCVLRDAATSFRNKILEFFCSDMATASKLLWWQDIALISEPEYAESIQTCMIFTKS
jgi:hypothetical protein